MLKFLQIADTVNLYHISHILLISRVSSIATFWRCSSFYFVYISNSLRLIINVVGDFRFLGFSFFFCFCAGGVLLNLYFVEFLLHALCQTHMECCLLIFVASFGFGETSRPRRALQDACTIAKARIAQTKKMITLNVNLFQTHELEI